MCARENKVRLALTTLSSRKVVYIYTRCLHLANKAVQPSNDMKQLLRIIIFECGRARLGALNHRRSGALFLCLLNQHHLGVDEVERLLDVWEHTTEHVDLRERNRPVERSLGTKLGYPFLLGKRRKKWESEHKRSSNESRSAEINIP